MKLIKIGSYFINPDHIAYIFESVALDGETPTYSIGLSEGIQDIEIRLASPLGQELTEFINKATVPLSKERTTQSESA